MARASARAELNFSAFREFAADVNVGKVHVVRPAGNDHAFDELVRILVNDLLVLERARLGFVSVANEIDRLGIRMTDKAPFEPAEAAPPRPRRPESARFCVVALGGGLIAIGSGRGHVQRLTQGLIATVAS